MAFLVRSDQAECRALGIPKLGHIPGIWSGDWQPVFEAIDYLIAKGTGDWVLGKLKTEYSAREPLSEATMLAIGHDLTNFLDWCEVRDANWRSLSYADLIETYQSDMQSGLWSQNSKRPLAPATINRRLSSVSDFLSFAAFSNVRGNFAVEHTNARLVLNAARSRTPDRAAHSSQRVGKVRQHPTYLRLPTLEESATWLCALRAKHGITPHLMAKTAVGLGLRAEETILLRAEQLPSIPSNSAVKSVRMEVCYGTKGGRDPTDPEKKGKARKVRVPIALLKELHGYKSGHRKLCLKRFRDKNPHEKVPEQLFLSKHTGAPLSYSRFYGLWKSTAQPFENFSPHLGRHMWACYTLVEKVKEEMELSIGVSGPIASFAASLHQSLIETWISPQLGHVDPKTSDMYLQWVTECFDMQSHANSWWDYLNEQI